MVPRIFTPDPEMVMASAPVAALTRAGVVAVSGPMSSLEPVTVMAPSATTRALTRWPEPVMVTAQGT